MKTFLFSISFTFLGIGIFVWVIQNIGFFNVIHAFSEFPWWGIFVVIALTLFNFWLGVIRWQRILRYQGIIISSRSLWSTWLAGFAFSYLTPITYIGGEAIRTGLLRSRFGIPAARGFGSIAIDKLLEGTIWMGVLSGGILFFLATLGIPVLNNLLLIGGGVALLGAGTVVLVYVLGFQRTRIVRKVLGVFGLENSYGGVFLEDVEHEVLEFFRFRNRTLWEGLGLSLAKNALLWARILFVVVLLGKGFQLSGSFIMLAFSYLGYSAPVPGGLGTHEIAQSFVFAGLGFGAESGIALSLLLRVAETLFVLLGVFFLMRFGIEFLVGNVIKLIPRIKRP